MEKIELVIKRMRQKVLYCNEIGEKDKKMEWYGIKSLRNPKQVEEKLPLENKLIALERNRKIRKTRSNIQKKIQESLK